MSRVDVKKLRQNLKMTQDEFAEKFHISVCTLRDWEQGRYQPTGPARVLLMVIETAPETVLQAVEAA